MSHVPLRLSAPKLPNIAKTLIFGLLTAALVFADCAVSGLSVPVWGRCALFFVITVAAVYIVSVTADAIVCLFEHDTVTVENGVLTAYGQTVALSDIKSVTLTPADKPCKTGLCVTSQEGKTVKVKQKYINIPVELLAEAIRLRGTESGNAEN